MRGSTGLIGLLITIGIIMFVVFGSFYLRPQTREQGPSTIKEQIEVIDSVEDARKQIEQRYE
ncbi:MAG: hypothetical protein O2794_03925 [bacterium]|nr:hypothetical protein [bacterium]